MESRLSTLATFGFQVRSSLEAKLPSFRGYSLETLTSSWAWHPEHDVKLRLGGLVLKGPQFDSDWG